MNFFYPLLGTSTGQALHFVVLGDKVQGNSLPHGDVNGIMNGLSPAAKTSFRNEMSCSTQNFLTTCLVELVSMMKWRKKKPEDPKENGNPTQLSTQQKVTSELSSLANTSVKFPANECSNSGNESRLDSCSLTSCKSWLFPYFAGYKSTLHNSKRRAT